MAESLAVCDELAARGQFIDASPLESVTTAVTVRVRGGQTLVTDGPFAETTEQLGGYYVLDLPDLDAAIAVACPAPAGPQGDGRDPPADRPSTGCRRAGRPSAAATRPPHPAPLLRRRGGVAGGGPGRHAGRDGGGRRQSAGGWARPERILSAAPLHPAATATCVRVRDGKRTVTDGPFAETHEVLGGYYLILADSRDAALRVAARHPGPGSGRSRSARCSTCPGCEIALANSGIGCRSGRRPFVKRVIGQAARRSPQVLRMCVPDPAGRGVPVRSLSQTGV